MEKEITNEQVNYIIGRVKHWDEGIIDFIELKADIKNCIKW